MKKKTFIFIIYVCVLLEIFFRILFPGSDITRVMKWKLDPDTMYELKPGAEMMFDGQMVRLPESLIRINNTGMRDNIYNKKKKNDKRMAFIGDSIVFGWGLPIEKTFIKLLESEIRTSSGNNDIYMMNFGVFGYNIHQYLSTLKNKVLPADPDMITVFLNRDDLINVARGFNPLRQKWIRVVQPVLRSSRVLKMLMVWGILIRNRIKFRQTDKKMEQDSYRDILEIIDICQKENIPLLFYVYENSHLTGHLFNMIESHIKNTVYKTPVYFSRKRKECEDRSLTFKGDPHPNRKGAACIAGDLKDIFAGHGYFQSNL